MTRWRASLAVSCALAAFTLPATAHASPSARLVYGRGIDAEHCPDEPALRKAVASRVGYDPFFPYASRTVVLTIAGADGGLSARIELIEGQRAGAARELVTRGSACEELFESVALAIAIAINPHALVSPSVPSEAEERPREPAPSSVGRAEPSETLPPPPPRSEERGPPMPRPGARARLFVAPRGVAGAQPGLAPGLFAGVSAVWKHTSLGGELGSYLPTVATSSSGAAVKGWLASVAFVPCLRLAPWNLCGVVSGGRFEGSGEGVVSASSKTAAFLAAGARAGVESSVSARWNLHLEAEVLGNFTRTTLKVGPETVWNAPPVAVAVAAAMSYEFE